MSDEDVRVHVCTEDDLSVGGYVLPKDVTALPQPTDAEREQLQAMFNAYRALIGMGWRDAMYAPKDPDADLLLIEVGSTGTHIGNRDGDGHFWIYDGDVWPAHPVLFKAKP